MILMKDFRKNYYSGLKGFYFYSILKCIIKIGGLRKRDVKILDFGCGVGKLKKLLGDKVVGYDIIPELSDVDDWRKVDFDVVVANEVFYLFSEEELRTFLNELYNCNPKVDLIVGISRQGVLNNFLKILAGQKNAHDGTKLMPYDELRILKDRMKVVKKRTVFFMCDIYLMRF